MDSFEEWAFGAEAFNQPADQKMAAWNYRHGDLFRLKFSDLFIMALPHMKRYYDTICERDIFLKAQDSFIKTLTIPGFFDSPPISPDKSNEVTISCETMVVLSKLIEFINELKNKK